jgi:hypothetical protein
MAAQCRRRAGCWDATKSLGGFVGDVGSAGLAARHRDETRDRAPLVKEGRHSDLGTGHRRGICVRCGRALGEQILGRRVLGDNGRRRGGQTVMTDNRAARASVDRDRTARTHALYRNISRCRHQAPLLSASGFRPSVRRDERQESSLSQFPRLLSTFNRTFALREVIRSRWRFQSRQTMRLIYSLRTINSRSHPADERRTDPCY